MAAIDRRAASTEGSKGVVYNGYGQRLDITIQATQGLQTKQVEANGTVILVPAGVPGSRAAAEHSK